MRCYTTHKAIHNMMVTSDFFTTKNRAAPHKVIPAFAKHTLKSSVYTRCAASVNDIKNGVLFMLHRYVQR